MKFILDKHIGESKLVLNNTTYLLKVSHSNATLHIMPKNAEPDMIDLTVQDLKALYLLLNTEDK